MEASAYGATSRLLAQAEPPTALFIANNEMLTGSLAALRAHKVGIPNELSLVSFDDVPWAEYVEPPLTVIAQPIDEIGASAAELLFKRLEGGGEAVKRVLTPRLIIRGSTGPPSS
jgi:LacI family transcriptional regulator